MRAFYGWKFAITVAVPLMLATLGVAFLTFDLVGRVSTGANREDHNRTAQVVQSALGALHKQIADITADNAYWDDAVRHAYGDIDVDWFEETWGFSTQEGINYDAVMIVDPDQGIPVAGYSKGKLFAPLLSNYTHGDLRALLDRLSPDTKNFSKMSTVMSTADGLAMVGAAPILPTSDDVVVPQPKPRFLVLIRFLTPEFMAGIGEQYVISHLTILPAAQAARTDELIKDFAGSPVAGVKWSDQRPGDIAREAIFGKVMIVLGFLALVMAGIGMLCWRLIAKISRSEASARHDALHDPLTGLPNRAALFAAIDALVKQEPDIICLAFADLDGFKEINDTYDHDTGDRLIQAVAAGLAQLTASLGTLYRLGGDEFVVLYRGGRAEEVACANAVEFIAFLEQPFDLDGRIAAVGASIGIATMEGDGIDAHELMRRADITMYQAKAAGKNRFLTYQSGFDAERVENLAIADKLRKIIAEDAIELAYQPVVNAKSHAIVGVEALARWPASMQPVVGPDRFCRVAESQGLIDDLGDAILRKACRDASGWGSLRLSVNISPVQLKNPEFAARTLRTIRASGLDPSRVEIEITEGTLLDDLLRAKHVFTQLQNAGVHVALDDFGSGYSSIGYLRQLSFDRIKIDRTLVEKMLTATAEQTIVQGTMLLAKGLTAAVTAEGVEHEEQIEVLRLCGCSELQGYFFHRPMKAAAIAQLLTPGAAAVDKTMPDRSEKFEFVLPAA